MMCCSFSKIAIPTRNFISLIFHVAFQVSFGIDGAVTAEMEVAVVDVAGEDT